MANQDNRPIEEIRKTRIEEINAQLARINRNLERCENVAVAFLGSGLVVLVLPFIFAGNSGELWTWLAASTGPFTVASLLYVAATNYQQQMQFLVTEKADLESQGHREQQTRSEEEQMREKQCERLLESYLRLRSSVDLLRPGFEVEGGAMTRGPAGFSLLKSEMMRNHLLDGADGAAGVPIKYKQRLAPFVKAIDGIILTVGALNHERRHRFQIQLEALLTQDERHVISMCQAINRAADQARPTLNEWLANNA